MTSLYRRAPRGGLRIGLGLGLVATLLLGSAHAAAVDPFAKELASRERHFREERARPEAVVPLLGLDSLWELVQDRASIVTFVERATRGAAQPEVKAHATFLLAQLYDRLGRRKEAEKLRASLGLITDFYFAGPFDNEGKAGQAQVYGPEAALTQPIDPKTRYDGKEQQVSWRRYPPVAGAGLSRFEPCLRPDASATLYATVAVHAPRALAAAVRVGSSGAIKVWVNGRLAISHDVYRPARFDQDAGAAELGAGWNRVTVKLSSDTSAKLGLYLRISRPDGAPFSGRDALNVSAQLADLNAPAPKLESRRERAKLVDLGALLEGVVKRRPKDARALTALGLYEFHVSPDDPELHRAADLLTRAVAIAPSPEAWGRLAATQIDPNDQHHSLSEGLALVKSKNALSAAPLHTRLGDLFSRERRERRAESEWLSALAADPTYYPASLKLAELAADRGMPSRAAAELHALAQALTPAPLLLLRAQANLALRRGRRAEAASWLQQIAKAAADDTGTLDELFSEARARGAVSQALGFLDRLTTARPDLLSTALDRAELYEGAGRLEEAHRALASALLISPDDPRLNERDGRILHRLGRDVEALKLFARSLDRKPQNPELRAYVEELKAHAKAGADPHGDLARAYALDVPTLIARYGKEKDASGAPARVLFDGTAIRVHSNGLSETFSQRVVQILDDRGAQSEGDFVIRFTPDTQSVEVRAAKLYRKDGEVLEAISTDEQDLSEPWYGLYYDVRGEVVRFSALQPGDVIDVEYVVSDVGRRNLLADYFGDLHFFQEDLPRTEQRYVLIAPKERTLYFNRPRLKALDRFESVQGDERIYTFHASHTPKVDSEPGMPGYSDVAAYLHVSTYRNWSDVAAWYRGLLKGQLDPDQAIITAVQNATRGLTDERAKIRALYDLVVRRTRYVGLEFGIHGYQPYRVAQVFARKFGDCKDKASLLAVMLRQAGIPASLVLARTRQGGDLDPEPASLAPFDHAIVWVPKYDLYLDGTAEFSGSSELPAQDQDIPVLQVSTGKLVRTPVLPASDNVVSTDWQVALQPSGDAEVQEHMKIAGEAAHGWRDHYQSPGERTEKYDQAWNGKHPGAKVESVQMSLTELEEPVTVSATIAVPRWAHEGGDPQSPALVMPALGRDPDMLRSYARLSSRKYDLVLGYPWRQEERVTVRLPAGFRVRRLPEARTVTTPFGKFTLTAEEHDGKVTVSGILEVDRHRIARADYPAFRRFCTAVDEAVGQELVVARAHEVSR